MSDLDPILRTDYKAVDKRDAVHHVWGWLTGDSAKVPIITDAGKAFGVINERALMSRRIDQAAHVENYALATRAVPDTASLAEVARRMAELRAAHLPVEDKKGKLRGYVSAVDVARAQGRAGTAADLAVPVTVLRGTQTIGEAQHAFQAEYVDFLPVMNGDGRVGGMLSRRALMSLEANASNKGRKDANGEKLTVLKDAIDGFTDGVVARVGARAPVEQVLATIEENGYALVEADDGRLIGVVTPATLLRSRS